MTTTEILRADNDTIVVFLISCEIASRASSEPDNILTELTAFFPQGCRGEDLRKLNGGRLW